MNQTLRVLIAALTLGAMLPAHAGPDLHFIEQARKARQTAQEMRQGVARETTTTCSPDALTLPLDHGPRAQATPYQNQLRKQEQAKTCANTTK